MVPRSKRLSSFAWGHLFPSPDKAVAWVPPASEKSRPIVTLGRKWETVLSLQQSWRLTQERQSWATAFVATLLVLQPPGLGEGTCASWNLLGVWLWMALVSHFASHEINWSSLFKLWALRHGNETVTMAVWQENACLTLSESTEAWVWGACLMNEGTALYVGQPLSFLWAPLLSSQSRPFPIMMWTVCWLSRTYSEPKAKFLENIWIF